MREALIERQMRMTVKDRRRAERESLQTEMDPVFFFF